VSRITACLPDVPTPGRSRSQSGTTACSLSAPRRGDQVNHHLAACPLPVPMIAGCRRCRRAVRPVLLRGRPPARSRVQLPPVLQPSLPCWCWSAGALKGRFHFFRTSPGCRPCLVPACVVTEEGEARLTRRHGGDQFAGRECRRCNCAVDTLIPSYTLDLLLLYCTQAILIPSYTFRCRLFMWAYCS
jgi:hypothetical protein